MITKVRQIVSQQMLEALPERRNISPQVVEKLTSIGRKLNHSGHSLKHSEFFEYKI